MIINQIESISIQKCVSRLRQIKNYQYFQSMVKIHLDSTRHWIPCSTALMRMRSPVIFCLSVRLSVCLSIRSWGYSYSLEMTLCNFLNGRSSILGREYFKLRFFMTYQIPTITLFFLLWLAELKFLPGRNNEISCLIKKVKE